MLKPKTWSRETAFALLGVFVWAVYKNNVEMVEVIVWPITTYAAIAFGLKRVDQSDGVWFGQSSESSNRGRPERSSEHPDR
jgi:hypothetical protein